MRPQSWIRVGGNVDRNVSATTERTIRETTKPTRRRSRMAKVIRCECGYVARGETDEELLASAERHIESDHPELVGRVSGDDLLAMAEEE